MTGSVARPLRWRSGLPGVYAALAARRPDEDAFVFAPAGGPERRYSWAHVVQRAHELADWLGSEGLAAGDRIGVECGAADDLVPGLLAAWSLGCVVVPLDPLWGGWLRERILSHCGAAAVLRLSGAAALERGAPVERPALPDDCAMVSYTSGTDGDPKGVILRHRHLLSAYRSAASALAGLTGGTPRTVGCAMRVSGLGVLGVHHLWAATMGARTVLLDELSIESARDHWQRLAAHRVELTYLVPALVALLNHARPPRPSDRALPTVLSGGAPLSAESHARFQRTFGVRLLNIYGLTEVAFAAFFGDVDEAGRGTASVGRPATVRARVRTADGELLAGAGEGQLELTGEPLTDGYYDNASATGDAIRDGWLRTGDVVRRDAGGRYWIVGRAKDVVMKGAFSVHLSEVESAAESIDGVVGAGAIRLDLPGGMEDVGLLVQVDGAGTPTAGALRGMLRHRLGDQRCPRIVTVTRPLPKVGHGKLDRRALAQLWQQAVTRG